MHMLLNSSPITQLNVADYTYTNVIHYNTHPSSLGEHIYNIPNAKYLSYNTIQALFSCIVKTPFVGVEHMAGEGCSSDAEHRVPDIPLSN